MYRSIARKGYSSASARVLHVKVFAQSRQRCVSAIALQGVRYFSQTLSSNYAAPAPSFDIDHEFFNFTRGRFLCDEKLELKRRHRTFNVYELMRIAAQAVGATHCNHIEKLPDGTCNRILLLSMDNGKQVVAKIPNPNAGRPHFTTASEVATMKFMREVIGTPLPEVYAWSSRAHETLVGAEFIIMEKVEGITLEEASLPLDSPEMFQVVKSIAEHVHAWSCLTFEQYGCLYFARDLERHCLPALRYTDSSGVQISDKRFVVGPFYHYDYLDKTRDTKRQNNGPWSSLGEFHTAIVERGLARLEHTAPLSPATGIYGPGLYQPSYETKIRALSAYLEIYHFMIPPDLSFSAPHISHCDLGNRHIFVDPNDSAKIVGIIGWQTTAILPFHFHRLEPGWFHPQQSEPDCDDDPSLPSDYKIRWKEHEEAHSLQFRRDLRCLYMSHLKDRSSQALQCLEICEDPVVHASTFPFTLFDVSETCFLFAIMMLEHEWGTLPRAKGMAFPIELSDEEKQSIVSEMLGVRKGVMLMKSLRESLIELHIINDDEKEELLLTTDDQYYAALNVLATLEALMIGEYAKNAEEAKEWKAQWPFRRE
ncbi:hypothetical protein D6C85_01954 [Aureobasidium pullulans]|uniref:Uncharacterized protein n=1 Tax=Aureobasidium pullulans TaxID=5580 RepID=A0A4S9XCP2_AURPU|nr:hypothetical protein D6C85_01954 [Aureobasidium pullulans]